MLPNKQLKLAQNGFKLEVTAVVCLKKKTSWLAEAENYSNALELALDCQKK